MGNLRSLKRSVTRSPDRVWLAKQKVKEVRENENKLKQKEEEKQKLDKA